MSAISLSLNKNHHIIFLGKINGKVSLKPKGENGFGYDPIFIPANYNKTFAEISVEEKNRIGHRGKAVKLLVDSLSYY